MRHLRRGILPVGCEGPSELNASPYSTEHQRGGVKDMVSRDSRKANPKTHEHSNRHVELHPNIRISVANCRTFFQGRGKTKKREGMMPGGAERERKKDRF